MKRKLTGVLAIIALLCVFTFVDNTVFAIKNVCPECNTLVEDMEATECASCGRAINKCLICGAINPAKNDNCYNCQASLAESRVLGTIDRETRIRLQLGESTRAQIEVELGQIKERIELDELTPDLAARQIELLTKLGWWSRANTLAGEFAVKFADSDKKVLVAACQVKALRNLGFLAMEEGNFTIAAEYLKKALKIDPKDTKSRNLLKAVEAK